jgi:hypothetical protein
MAIVIAILAFAMALAIQFERLASAMLALNPVP